MYILFLSPPATGFTLGGGCAATPSLCSPGYGGVVWVFSGLEVFTRLCRAALTSYIDESGFGERTYVLIYTLKLKKYFIKTCIIIIEDKRRQKGSHLELALKFYVRMHNVKVYFSKMLFVQSFFSFFQNSYFSSTLKRPHFRLEQKKD